MKLNFSNPARSIQKSLKIDKTTEMKLYDKKIGDLFEGNLISPEFAGFTFKITGGDDLQGFPMKAGVKTAKRVRLLLKKGESGYRCRRDGVRRRKSVRGGIISNEISALALTVVAEGTNIIQGLNDKVEEKTHLPKRVDRLRKLLGIPENVPDFYAAVKNFLLANAGEGNKKMPRLRITRLPNEKKEREKKENLEKRKKRKEIFEKEKKEYERKYLTNK